MPYSLLKNSIFALGLLLAASSVAAQVTLPNPLCSGGGSCIETIPALIGNIATYLFNVVGAIAVVVIIWAGILFLTSTGNEARLGTAKKALLYAAIGLAIAMAGTGLIELVKFIITG